MAISFKHLFSSVKADGPDPTLIQPSNWNAEHAITMATGNLLGRVAAGTGTWAELNAAAIYTFLNVLTDGTLAANSDTALPSQKAMKTYVDLLRTLVVGNQMPPGAVQAFAMAAVPTGWLECDGSAISRVTYAPLFANISTLYGIGDGSTTFGLPDYRGQFLRGWDHGRGVDAGRTIGSAQADLTASHTHTASSVVTDPGHTHTITNTGTNLAGTIAPSGGGSLNTGAPLSANAAPTGITVATTVNATGGAETRPKNAAVLVCIKI
jgi:microcystin-dependent protein